MDGFKTMLQSATIRRSLYGILTWIIAAGGYTIAEADSKTVIDTLIGLADTEWGPYAVAMAVANAACYLGAIYGRVKATTRIG